MFKMFRFLSSNFIYLHTNKQTNKNAFTGYALADEAASKVCILQNCNGRTSLFWNGEDKLLWTHWCDLAHLPRRTAGGVVSSRHRVTFHSCTTGVASCRCSKVAERAHEGCAWLHAASARSRFCRISVEPPCFVICLFIYGEMKWTLRPLLQASSTHSLPNSNREQRI